jgi:hypothetical protein
MAKIKFSKLLDEVRGKIGKLVIRRRPDGTFIFSGAPTYKKNRGTPRQKAHWERVSDAAHDAKFLAKMHPIYAQLAAEDKARGKWMSAYNFAFADCMKPPVIHRVEWGEGCIRVEATDNILVTEVYVTILDETGNPLETGQASRAADDWWEYPTQKAGKTVEAVACDLARNMTKFVR